MSPRLSPTYGELHRATVAICQALHESPLSMLSGEPCQARAYLAEVLTRAYPETAARQVLRWCGSRNVDRDAERAAKLMSGDDWRDDIVGCGLVSLGRSDLVGLPSEAAFEEPPAPARPAPAPQRWSARPAPDGRPNPYRRVTVHQPATGSLPLGEPPAGRSALDQQRAAVAAAASSTSLFVPLSTRRTNAHG